MMRIETYLSEHASRTPDKIALVAGGKRLSYAAFDAASSALAASLVNMGIGRGDRVLLFLDNSWEAAVSIYAIAKADAVFAPINAATKAQKLAYLIDHFRPSAVITRTRMANVLAEALGQTRTRPRVIVAGKTVPALPDATEFESLLTGPTAPPAQTGTVDDLAMLICTSGSTGQPKGVMMTHANIEAAARPVMAYLRNTSDDIIFSVLSLAHSYGLYQLLTAVMAGATLVLEKSFAFPRVALETMKAERATAFPLVPSMAAVLLDQLDPETDHFPDLRYISSASAPLPETALKSLQDLFPGVELFSMYGMTECKRATYLPPERIGDKAGSVGIAIPGTEVFVVDEYGERVAPGITGELMVRGAHVMQGYWEDPEATARVLQTGPAPDERMLASGDLFYADDEGFFYCVGRKDDIIKTRGEKVPPKEVEAVLATHPDIAQALVFGKDDPVLGQAICAIVVPRNSELTEQDVMRFCARQLEDFMVPKTVIFRDSLPTTDTGKLSRRLAAESLV